MKRILKFEIEKPEPLYHVIKKKILRMIAEGELKEGDKLPPEEEIAKMNGISKGTVRMALMDLVKEGILVRYPKRGTFVTSTKARVTYKICIYSSTIPASKREADYYRSELWGGIEEGSIEEGVSLIFSDYEEKVDGILYLVPLRREIDILNKIKENKIPMVIVGAKVEGFNYVAVDNERGTEQAIKHLIDLGHRKIGGIFPTLEQYDIYHRYNTFLNILKENGLPVKKEWVKVLEEENPSKWIEKSEKAIIGILNENEKPTAIFAATGFTNVGVMRGVRKKELKIPDDISIVGFDDFYLASHLEPPLTVVWQPIWDLGKVGVKMLVEIIRKKPNKLKQEILETKLIVRDSTKRERR